MPEGQRRPLHIQRWLVSASQCFSWPCALRSRKAWHNRGLTLSLRARKLRPKRLREWPGRVLFAHSGRQRPASQNLGARRNLRSASSLEAGMPRHSRDLAGCFRCERWPVTARTPGRCIRVHPVRGNHYVHVTLRQNFKMQKLGASGWLSQLSVQLGLRSRSHGSWGLAPCQALC